MVKKRRDDDQLKMNFRQGEQELKPEHNAMLVDISYPLHAYHPGIKCPNCGRKVRSGCPVLCTPSPK